VLRKYKSSGGGDLLREGDPEKAAMVDVWLEVPDHQYEPAIAQIVRHCVILPMIGAGGARDQRVVDESAGKLRAVLAAYEDYEPYEARGAYDEGEDDETAQARCAEAQQMLEVLDD